MFGTCWTLVDACIPVQTYLWTPVTTYVLRTPVAALAPSTKRVLIPDKTRLDSAPILVRHGQVHVMNVITFQARRGGDFDLMSQTRLEESSQLSVAKK